MGASSLTIFQENINEPGSEICVLYRQMDGYPTGHGADLKSVLENAVMGNGIPGGLGNTRFFNGFQDLVPQTITRLKLQQTEQMQKLRSEFRHNGLRGYDVEVKDPDLEPGGYYMHPPGTRDYWEEYIYIVYLKDNYIYLKVEGDLDYPIYDGPIDEFDPVAVEAAEREEMEEDYE